MLARAVVGWNDDRFVVADAEGRYAIDTGGTAGIAWVRTPDGFSPAPAWVAVAEADPDTVADLGLVRSLVDGPLRFVVAADTHIGYRRALDGTPIDGAALYAAMYQAAEIIPEPHFVTLVGDMTHRSDPEEQSSDQPHVGVTDTGVVIFAGAFHTSSKR